MVVEVEPWIQQSMHVNLNSAIISSLTLGDLQSHSVLPILHLQKGDLLHRVMIRINHDVHKGLSRCLAHCRCSRRGSYHYY